MKIPMLAMILCSVACVEMAEDDVTTSSQAVAICAPNAVTVIAIERDGKPVAPSTLSPLERQLLDLTLAHQSVYGEAKVKCEFHSHAGTEEGGWTSVCTDGKTTCVAHFWDDGPEATCQGPSGGGD